MFLRYLYKIKLTWEETDNEQIKLVNELKVMDRGIKLDEK